MNHFEQLSKAFRYSIGSDFDFERKTRKYSAFTAVKMLNKKNNPQPSADGLTESSVVSD